MVCAQTPPHLPPGGLIQLQVAQPGVDVSSPVSATAAFDPPVVRPGEKAFYRVNINATESSITWPDDIATPEKLIFRPKARGMITQMQANSFRPLTAFVYEVQTMETGHFTVTNFSVDVSGTRVEIPAASLDVATNASPAIQRQLVLQISDTNMFLGQPFRVQVMLPTGPGNQIEAVREIQLNGDGLMTDKTALRQSAGPVNINGEIKTAFICEMIVTPIAAGPLAFSAQGFTAGTEFTAPFIMRGQINFSGGPAKYVLLASDPVTINVRPLPVEGELPGFTGAIGKFFSDPPQLSTNRLRVGEPVQLRMNFHGEGDLSRMASPAAPRSRDWQIIADPPPATSFTLIPLTDDTHETPAIPFSYFDPEIAKYVDLTIPPLPVTVVGEGLPAELPTFDDTGKSGVPLKLTAPAASPGKTLGNLKPLQLRGWFAGLQLVPLAAFLALWQWDRRRRYLEAHPEIVRRTQARRALRREKQQLQKAVAAGDGAAFVRHAARAMNIAVAPHFPADPQALVGGDVLAQLDDAERTGLPGDTVKKVFAAADAQFAGTPQISPDLPALRSGVDTVLQRLEEKL
ncbi:MAG TPA: hypothetical protein VH251_01995 [Verrucomicrobiae bacterium]|nr:hypothetical protein [Verrucomicrobiae bacterium]